MSSASAIDPPVLPGTLSVDITGIGLLGPGLADWDAAALLLREPAGWQSTPTAVPVATRLPPTERRRAGAVVRLSCVVADEACRRAGLEPSQLASVFTSSTGEPANCHALCEALAAPERAVSPTRFTNSVHNAAGGYWHIAVQGRRASTSIAAFDASFAAGLLEAAVQCLAGNEPVLLVAADVPYPEPLHSCRPLPDAFGVAMVLRPGRQLQLRLAPGAAASHLAHPGLQALQTHIPAARALPLLAMLAGAPYSTGRCTLEGWDGLALEASLG
jgi:hypothetical protein